MELKFLLSGNVGNHLEEEDHISVLMPNLSEKRRLLIVGTPEIPVSMNLLINLRITETGRLSVQRSHSTDVQIKSTSENS